MLKFATKKPPRYKHYDEHHGAIDQGRHGDKGIVHYHGDEGGNLRLAGDYTRFDPVNGDEMLDYDIPDEYTPHGLTGLEGQGTGYHGNQMDDPGSRGQGSVVQGSTSPLRSGWKSPVLRYDRFGNEIHEVPVSEVGMSRNGGQVVQGQGQRSQQYNPGYVDRTLDYGAQQPVRHEFDRHDGMNNLSPVHMDTPRPRDDYPPMYHSPRSVQPFPVLPLTSEPSYSIDSTASMSIDSMSGDRSSKSTMELQDYDHLVEMSARRNIDGLHGNSCHHSNTGYLGSSGQPVRHRHVHVGRGTHGVCETPASPGRPGSGEGQMTSSLRKSPSGVKSQHHVRWDPVVMNGEKKQTLIPISELQANASQAKKGTKKKKSLRSMLNLPKNPFSDNESSDTDGGQSGLSGKPRGDGTDGGRGSLRRLFDSRGASKHKVAMADSQPITTTSGEPMASLRYKQDYQVNDNLKHSQEFDHQRKGNFTKLDIARANQGIVGPFSGSFNDQNADYDLLLETNSVTRPIVHSQVSQSQFSPKMPYKLDNESKTKSQSPVKSVRPFLINGQSNESHDQDYDNYTESETSSSRDHAHISVNTRSQDKFNVLHQGEVSQGQGGQDLRMKPTPVDLYYHQQQVNRLHLPASMSMAGPAQTQAPAVSFDTFVTLGRPSDSSVTFDTFVTLGRPYATSTPVPNGVSAFRQYVGQGTPYNTLINQNNKVPVQHLRDVNSGHPSSTVTQSWNYSSGSQPATQTVQSNVREPVMKTAGYQGQYSRHVTSPTESHDHGVKNVPIFLRQTSGPYEMDNRTYGKLSLSPTTFLMDVPEAFVSQSSSQQQQQQQPVLHSEPTIRHTVSSKDHVDGDQGGGVKGQGHQAATQGQEVKATEFKDHCRYRARESPDYDDDVFQMIGLTPGTSLQAGQPPVKRKLEFEGSSAYKKPVS